MYQSLLKGRVLSCRLQQLCTWAAEPLRETELDSQTRYPTVQARSQRISTQVGMLVLLCTITLYVLRACVTFAGDSVNTGLWKLCCHWSSSRAWHEALPAWASCHAGRLGRGSTSFVTLSVPQHLDWLQWLCFSAVLLLSVPQIAKDVNRPDVQNQSKQGGHTASYIRAQKDKLMQSVRGSYADPALDSFYKGMSVLCSQPESCINHMHLNAIIGATAGLEDSTGSIPSAEAKARAC